MKKKDIKIVLHAPRNPIDISYLQEIHNEMVTSVLRKQLLESGGSKKEKTECLTRIIKTI